MGGRAYLGKKRNSSAIVTWDRCAVAKHDPPTLVAVFLWDRGEWPHRPFLPPLLEGLHRCAARAILLRLPARVFEEGLCVGLHEIAGLDPLEAVTL